MSYEQKFNVIDLLPNVAVGIKIPFVNSNGALFNQSYSVEDQVLTNLKSLILTRKGERIYQPFFGTDLQNTLFEQNDDTIISKISSTIEEAVAFWLPYVKIRKLLVTPVIAVRTGGDEHGVRVEMEVGLDTTTANKSVTFLVTPSNVQLI